MQQVNAMQSHNEEFQWFVTTLSMVTWEKTTKLWEAAAGSTNHRKKFMVRLVQAWSKHYSQVIPKNKAAVFDSSA